MKPSLRQIEAFVAVYRLGGVSKAARQLGLTQSAVSMLIRQMEENLGAILFERSTRSLRPTVAAVEAIGDAERVLNEFERLDTKLRNIGKKSQGHLSVALSAGVAAALGGTILYEFQKRYPGVKLELRDIAPTQVASYVRDGKVDFGIGGRERDETDIRQETLLVDTVSAICRRSDIMARRSSIRWDELTELSTITTPRGDRLRALIDESLAQHGKAFAPTYEVSYLATALSMAAQGVGIAVMPSHLVPNLQGPTLVGVRLVDPIVRRQLCLIRRADHIASPAAKAFSETVTALLARDSIGRLDTNLIAP